MAVKVYEITLACRNLIALDQGSPSDPVIFLRLSDDGKKLKSIGRTEELMDASNPEFVQKFIVAAANAHRRLVLNVYDIDSTSANLADHDLIGNALVKLDKVIESSQKQGVFYEHNLFYKKEEKSVDRGFIRIFAEEYVGDIDAVYTFQLAAFNLPEKYSTTMHRRKVFVEIHKRKARSQLLVYRSEAVQVNNNRQADWKSFTLNSFTLASNHDDRELTLTLLKFGKNGAHKKLAEFNTNLAELKKPGQHFESCNGGSLKIVSISAQLSEVVEQEKEKYEEVRKSKLGAGGIAIYEDFSSEHTGHEVSAGASKVWAAITAISAGTAQAAVDSYERWTTDE